MLRAALALTALLCASCAAERPPNIIFIMADQLRSDFASFTGSHTPNLDRLAREGASFARHFSSVPICTPARAAILASKSPWHHGMFTFGP